MQAKISELPVKKPELKGKVVSDTFHGLASNNDRQVLNKVRQRLIPDAAIRNDTPARQREYKR